jgi:hypothetical protein
VFNADGTPTANDFVVQSTLADVQQAPSVAALPDARLVVTWETALLGVFETTISGAGSSTLTAPQPATTFSSTRPRRINRVNRM